MERSKRSPKTKVFKPVLISAAVSKGPVHEACASFLCPDISGGCWTFHGECLIPMWGYGP